VAAGIVVLFCLPVATSAATSLVRGLTEEPVSTGSAQVLIRRALDSGSIAHSGLARSTGTLGLPDLPQLSDVASVLGGTTRTRVWWVRPESWRVDVLTATGEQGIYASAGRTVRWDYEQSRLSEVVGSPWIRLPRADDLLPPQLARRLLAGVGAGDRVQVLSARRSVAGVRAEGVRIVPGDRRSTIGRVDVWLDPERGLPVAVEVVDSRGVTAVRSAFVELKLAVPKSSTVRVPAAQGAQHDLTDAPDLVGRLQWFNAGPLPARLAGLTSSTSIIGGAATYGSGLVRFVVLPLPGRLADQLVDAARTGGGTELSLSHGQGVLVSSGLLNLVVVRGANQLSYLAVGLVSDKLLTEVAEGLAVQPGGRWLE
jgi:hypothetical protein